MSKFCQFHPPKGKSTTKPSAPPTPKGSLGAAVSRGALTIGIWTASNAGWDLINKVIELLSSGKMSKAEGWKHLRAAKETLGKTHPGIGDLRAAIYSGGLIGSGFSKRAGGNKKAAKAVKKAFAKRKAATAVKKADRKKKAAKKKGGKK